MKWKYVLKNPGSTRFLVGIDEAGRGPLAGPVSVGVVIVPVTFNFNLFRGLKDSKQLSEDQREIWFNKLKELKKQSLLDYSVALVGSQIIDEKGIVHAVKVGMRRCLKRINAFPPYTHIALDGSLYAPEEFISQETIIKGDARVPIIALASVAAKVTRDRRMVRLSKEFPEYLFDIHKGYGTKKHIKAIRSVGPCELHRKSFIKGITA